MRTLGIVCAALVLCGAGAIGAPWANEGKRLKPLVVHIPAESPDDGYWPWLNSFRRERDDVHARIGEIRIELGALAQDTRSLRARWLRALYLDYQTVPSAQVDPGWGRYFESFLTEENRNQVDVFFHYWTSGWLGTPIQTSPSGLGAQTSVSFRRQRDAVRAEMEAVEKRKGALIEEALSLHRTLRASIGGQQARSGGRRPQLEVEAGGLEQEEPLVKLQLYDAAEWYQADQLPALIEQLGDYLAPNEAAATLVRAKLLLARTEDDERKIQLQLISPAGQPPDQTRIMASRTARLEGMLALRRVLEINPNNADARQLLQREELHWVERIATLIQQQKQVSMSAFHTYLEQRGFPVKESPKMWDTIYDYGIAMWGMGPIALSGGIVGLPTANAELVGAQQLEAARHQTSLMLVARLLRNGVQLSEIPGLSREQFRQAVKLRTATRGELPEAQSTILFVDMRRTFSELEVLGRLASRDTSHFVEDVNLAMGARFYAPVDSTYHSWELFGDVFNVKNIVFMWGPNSIVRAGGDLAKQRLALRLIPGAEIRAAQEAGEVVTAAGAFVQTVGLARLAETLGATSTGQRLAASWKILEKRRQAMGAIEATVDMGAQLTSAVLLFGGLSVAADEYNIPGGQILVEILAELYGSEYLADAVIKGSISVERLAGKVDDFARSLSRYERRLGAQGEVLEELGELVRRAETDPPDPATLKQLRGRLAAAAESPGTPLPAPGSATRPASTATPPPAAVEPGATTKLQEGIDNAIDSGARAAMDALESGDVAEARRVVQYTAVLAEEGSHDVRKWTEKLSTAKGAVKGVAQVNEIAIRQPPFPTLPRKEGGILAKPDKFWQPDLYETGDEIGALLKAGDIAVRDGNLAAAAQNYRNAINAIENSKEMSKYGRHLTVADGRLALVTFAEHDEELIALARREAGEFAAGHPFSQSEVDEVVRLFDGGSFRPVSDPEEVISQALGAGAAPRAAVRSANSVMAVEDSAGNLFFVKRAKPKGTETQEELNQILAMEASCAGLARLAGIDVPATIYLPDQGLLISRAVANNVPMSSVHEHTMLALKKDYARGRVFRAWVGDTDGHFGNNLIDAHGRLVQIDFDLATFSGFSRHMGGDLPGDPGDAIAAMLYSHQTISHGPYAWMARLDQMTRYEDVAETVQEIVKLAELHRSMESVGGTGVLRQVLENSGFKGTDDAVKMLLNRADALERAVKQSLDKDLLNLGGGLRPEHLQEAA